MTKKYSILVQKGRIFLPLITLLLIGITACSVSTYIPVSRPGVDVEGGFAVLRADSIWVAMRPQSWQGDPASVNSYFFPLHIRVRNLGKHTAVINPSDIVILVDGEQYDPVSMQSIISVYHSNPFLDQYNQPFMTDRVVVNPEKQQQIIFAIIQGSFSFGTLVGGGLKSGYVFFPGHIQRAKSITLKAFGHDIEFRK